MRSLPLLSLMLWLLPSLCLAVEQRWELIPSVIRSDGQDSFVLEVNPGRAVTAVDLLLYTGSLRGLQTNSRVPLRDDGTGADRVARDGVYSAGPFRFDAAMPFPSSPYGQEYDPQGLSFLGIGIVELVEVDGSTRSFRQMVELGLLRPDVPLVHAVKAAPDVKLGPHLINIDGGTGMSVQRYLRQAGTADLQRLTRRLYEVVTGNLRDDPFDHLFLLSSYKLETQDSAQADTAGTHITTRVDFSGTGRLRFSESASYGSWGRLQSLNLLDTGSRGLNSLNALHELLHQWGAYLDPGLGLSSDGHFSPRSNVGSLIGGFSWSRNTDGSYTIDCRSGRNGASRASPLDLYLAGFMDAASVPMHYHYRGDFRPCGSTLQASEVHAVSMSEIQARHGERQPGAASSPKSFRLGFVVESRGRLLNPVELTFYDRLAEHLSAPLPAHAPDPLHTGSSWFPMTRFFGPGVSWSSVVRPVDTVRIEGRFESDVSSGGRQEDSVHFDADDASCEMLGARRYRCLVQRGWTGVIRPLSTGAGFSPASRSYTTPVVQDMTEQNYRRIGGGNRATVYYLTSHAWTYMHHQLEGGSWTALPGTAMRKATEACGHTVLDVELGPATYLLAAFNDGQGRWDNNRGANYRFGAGIHTLSDGVVSAGAPTTAPCRPHQQRLSVFARPAVGEQIHIVGNIPELGNWIPGQGPRLQAGASPEWNITLTLPAPRRIEYKYVRVDSGGRVVWERGGNRVLDTTVPNSPAISDGWFR